MALSSLARHYLNWERPDISVDDARGATRTFDLVRARVPCLVQPLSARERALYGQRGVLFSHKVYFDQVLALWRGDRFLEASSGRVFVIVGWFDQGGQGGRCFCVECQEQAT